MLCPYKHIFGKEKEGVHSLRLFDIAVVDVVLTILAAVLIARYFKLNLVFTLLVLFILGILLHRLFCVNTTINKMIFGYIK